MSTNYIETYILIYPNAGDVGDGDDWSSTSPFTGQTCTTAFVVSNISGVNLGAGYTTLSNRLTDISDIDRSVDLFGLSSTKNSYELEGLGGVVKVSDFSFTIQNVNNDVSVFDLIGRKVVVQLLVTTAQTIFTGRIYTINPSNKSVEFVVRGNSQLWDKEIGTISNVANEEYKGKIYPICFGELNSDEAAMPIILDNDVNKLPKLYLSENKIQDIELLSVWDDEQKKFHNVASNISDFVVDSDNKYISLNTDVAVTVASISATSDDLSTIYISDAPKIAMELSGTPSLTEGDIYYKDVGGTDYYVEYVREDSTGIHIFKATNDSFTAGVFTYQSGSGPASITATIVSGLIYPDWWPEQTTEDVNALSITSSAAGLDKAKPTSSVIKIDDEEMLILGTLEQEDATYVRTRLSVLRGYNNTTKAAHTLGATVYSGNEQLKNEKLLVNAIFPLKDISNFRITSAPPITDYILEMKNMYNLINNFQYLPAEDTDRFHMLINGNTYLVTDLAFGKTDFSGEIKDMFLLGSFEVEPLDGSSQSYIYLATSDTDEVVNKRYGFNKYNARLNSVMTPGQVVKSYSTTDATLGLYQIVMSLYGYNIWNNNIENATQEVTDYLIKGGWREDSGTYYYDQFAPTSGEPNYLTNINLLDDFRLAFIFINTGINKFYLNNIGIRVDFLIDPLKYKLWAKGKAQIFDGTYSATHGEFTNVDFTSTSDRCEAIAFGSTYTYAALGDVGARIYDSSMSVIDTQDDGGYYNDIYADGLTVFVAALDGGLHKYNVVAGSLSLAGTYTPTSNGATANSVRRLHSEPYHDLIFMCNDYSGEDRLYVTNASLTYLAYQSFSAGINNVYVMYRDSTTEMVYVCADGRIYTYIFDTVSNTFTQVDYDDIGTTYDVFVVGGVVFVAAGGYGLYIYQSTDGVLSLLKTIRTKYAVAVEGNSSYVAVTNMKIGYPSSVDLFYYSETSGIFDYISHVTNYATDYTYFGAHISGSYWYLDVGDVTGTSGVERVSLTSTNTLIENPVNVIEHLIYKELGLDSSNVDAESFNDSILGRDKYKLSMVIADNPIKFRAIAEKICKEHGLILSETYDGKLAIRTVERNNSLRTINNSELLLSGNVASYLSEYTPTNNMITSLSARYKKRITDGQYVGVYDADALLKNDFDVAKNIIDVERKATFNLDTVRDNVTLFKILNLIGDYYKQPLRIITIDCTMSVYDVKLGSWIDFENDTYVKNTSGKEYLVISQNIQVGYMDTEPYIKLKLLEITPYAGSYVFGDGSPSIANITAAGGGSVS